ncbi:MAG: hypothetical protein IKS58_04300, partial [Paludibacteraceae bacterium]|nr:hypothetical protein [Paludibacteraceae bacterium]
MNKLRILISVLSILLTTAIANARPGRGETKVVETESTAPASASEQTDSKEEKKPEKKKKLTSGEAVVAWHVQEPSAIEIPTTPDTLHLNYQLATTPVYIKHIGAEWLGNMGLPAQPTVFSERTTLELLGDNMFLNPYRPYYLGVEDVYFYNTRVPYTNISFYTGGYTKHGEDRLKGLFSINANQRLNFGLCFDYIYGRGSFYSQSSDALNGAFNLS